MQKADKLNNWHYNKILQPYANKLRKHMTKSEACLCSKFSQATTSNSFPQFLHEKFPNNHGQQR